jgi:exonuclease SbcD
VKIAHLADLHLGFRQYYRQTPNGINQREADIANAFRCAVDDLIAARPDAILLAGDIFHAVRPSNHSIIFAFHQFQRLRQALPEVPIVAIAGNHDTPRSSETGSILRLYEEVGIHLASEEPRRLSFPELQLSVFAVPHSAMISPERTVLSPEGPESYQVLMLHGEIEGAIPLEHPAMEYGGALIDPESFKRENWTYVALGHYHVQHQVGPRIWYSGSLEYVSRNLWGELADERKLGKRGKGWLLVDLDSGTVTRKPVPPARTIHDAPAIDGAGDPPAVLDRAIGDRLAEVPGGLPDAIVRVIARNVPRAVSRELDHAAIRAAKAQALHLQVDCYPPDDLRLIGVGSTGRRVPLPELLSEFLQRRPLPARVSRERFISLGLELLAETEDDSLGGAA